MTRLLILLFCVIAATPAAAQFDWSVDHASSRLEYAVVIGGTKAKGAFESWVAHIRFDPDQLDTGMVRVEVDMTSVSVADERALAVGNPDWLGVEDYPMAVFQSERFDLTENGVFSVSGWLELKGKRAPLTLEGTLHIQEKAARAELTGTIYRLAHGIGVGQGAVAADVTIKVTLQARRNPN